MPPTRSTFDGTRGERYRLADAKLDDHGRDRGHRHRGMRGRVRDNIGGAVSRRISAVGFTLASTRAVGLRIGGQVGIEVAHPSHH